MGFSPYELILRAKKEGWVLDRIKGSHHIFFHEKTNTTLPIPVHGNKDLGKGLYIAIEKILDKIKKPHG